MSKHAIYQLFDSRHDMFVHSYVPVGNIQYHTSIGSCQCSISVRGVNEGVVCNCLLDMFHLCSNISG